MLKRGGFTVKKEIQLTQAVLRFSLIGRSKIALIKSGNWEGSTTDILSLTTLEISFFEK